MKRISKSPEERRNELIDAATLLFLEKGYEATAVSDIVKHIHVAQGTFYYHFKSKSDILEAVVDRFISAIETTLGGILNQTDKKPSTRFNDAINYLIEITGSNKEFIDYLHQESNAVMHERISRMTMMRLVPVLTSMVAHGVESGEFTVHYPEETVETILSALFWQFHQPGLMENRQKLERVKITLEHFLDRMLGLPEHTFVLNLN